MRLSELRLKRTSAPHPGDRSGWGARVDRNAGCAGVIAGNSRVCDHKCNPLTCRWPVGKFTDEVQELVARSSLADVDVVDV